MKKRIVLLMALVMMICLGCFGCGSPDSEGKQTTDATTEKTTEAVLEQTTEIAGESDSSSEASSGEEQDELLSGIHKVVIDVKDYGTISVDLDADTAPITVTNFIKLAQSGFYDGLTFHRIMEGFMIQGGDPTGTGMGGSEETIKGEFAANGVENRISHKRGTISMARSMENDSASSQFFIVHKDSTFLDGQYAGFGTVTEGMEVVDQICADAQPTDDNGTIPADAQPVINSITVIE